MSETVRVDRWAWAVRLFPSRTAATRACAEGEVTVDGEPAKPARRVAVGQEVRIRRRAHETVVVVSRVIERRVGAPVAAGCYDDLTPPRPEGADDPLHPNWVPATAPRAAGAGRPTKRERRDTDRLRGQPGRSIS